MLEARRVLGHVLAVANLERLQEQLEDYDLMRAAALLEQGRPKLLQDLKKAGVSSLVDRQALCGAISKAVKAGELHAVASLTEDAAAQLVCAAARGDGAGVLSALQAGASATSCDGRGTTACMAAAEQCHSARCAAPARRCECRHASYQAQPAQLPCRTARSQGRRQPDQPCAVERAHDRL